MKKSASIRQFSRHWSKAHQTDTALVNPRPPAVPAGMHITIEQYYATAAMIGLLQGQTSEPDKEWVAEWCVEMANVMHRTARKAWGK